MFQGYVAQITNLKMRISQHKVEQIRKKTLQFEQINTLIPFYMKV